jgi:hypothetical protein
MGDPPVRLYEPNYVIAAFVVAPAFDRSGLRSEWNLDEVPWGASNQVFAKKHVERSNANYAAQANSRRSRMRSRTFSIGLRKS